MTNPYDNLADFLSFWHFDESVMVHSNGALGVGFQITGRDIGCKAAAEINDFNSQVRNLLNTGQEGLKLQLFYRVQSSVTELINSHHALSPESDEKYQTISQERVRFFRKKANSGEYFHPELYFFIKSAPLKHKSQSITCSNRRFLQSTREEYSKHKAEFLRNAAQIETSLAAAGLAPRALSAEQWFHILFEALNPDRCQQIGVPALSTKQGPFVTSLPERLVLSDCVIHREYLELDQTKFRILTLKVLPEETYASMGNILLTLPFHCWISQNVELLNQKKEYDALQLKRKFTHSMSMGSGTMSDIESESKLGHIESLISELLESSERILASDLNIIIWGKTEAELEEKSDEVLRVFRNLNQAEGIVESYPGFDAYVQALPGACEGLRKKKMKTSNVTHLMPLYDHWRGNERPVCLLPNRDSVLVAIDPFDKSLPNWNGLVIGSSGSGKSFALSQLVLMFYGQTPKPKIVWLDNGASSKNLVDCLGGQFIELNLESKICLNPFDLGPGETTPSPSKVKLILGVIETICKEDENRGLPKVERALLEEAIYRVYKSIEGIPTLSDLKSILMEHPRSEIRKYAEILYSWTGNTAYGRLLDGQTNVRLEKNLVSFELRGLDVHEELQNVFLLVLTDYIQREASSDIQQNYLLIIDEAWKLLQSKSGAAFTIEAYRTFRKFNAGIWAISQNVNDFKSQGDIASAILQNTPSRLILKQRGVDWEEFQAVLSLNDTDINLIKSLSQEKGVYSEFYFIQDENKSVLRMEPDPLSYFLCTTDPKDKSLISSIQKKNPKISKFEAIKSLSSKES